jgi:uncharacterized membrane protein YeaQ/YmgE (transglycosylase-associated protein family)
MFHLIWYVLIGLISGVIAKSVMHVHMTIFWTIVLGIIGSIIGGAVTHMFSHPDKPTLSSRRPHFFHTGRDPGSFHLLQAEDSFPRSQPVLVCCRAVLNRCSFESRLLQSAQRSLRLLVSFRPL